MALLMTIATAFTIVGSAHVARHRAFNAADLSALTAARLVMVDPTHACGAARSIAHENAAELVRCTITDETVDVWTSTTITLPGLGQRTVTAQARAGPSRIDPGRPTPSPPSP
ncbi:Rv3654c family TadE-like protein [Nonomuraea sp. NPDC050556]|uniref:Rv3654c family TadE-like protein n=1 Tax=Nonomuraea sp. NPDC050556 TaxID=3364369 RepID=UPI0037BB501C